jgi:hypothetical protein
MPVIKLNRSQSDIYVNQEDIIIMPVVNTTYKLIVVYFDNITFNQRHY